MNVSAGVIEDRSRNPVSQRYAHRRTSSRLSLSKLVRKRKKSQRSTMAVNTDTSAMTHTNDSLAGNICREITTPEEPFSEPRQRRKSPRNTMAVNTDTSSMTPTNDSLADNICSEMTTSEESFIEPMSWPNTLGLTGMSNVEQLGNSIPARLSVSTLARKPNMSCNVNTPDATLLSKSAVGYVMTVLILKHQKELQVRLLTR